MQSTDVIVSAAADGATASVRVVGSRIVDSIGGDPDAVSAAAGTWAADDGRVIVHGRSGPVEGAVPPDRPVIDSRVLASVLWPDLPSHDLDALLATLPPGPAVEIPEDLTDPDAAAACVDTVRLWQAAEARARSLPEPVLDEIAGLFDTLSAAPMRKFFARAADDRRGTTETDPPSLWEIPEEDPRPRIQRDIPTPDERVDVDPAEAAELLGPTGAFAERLDRYEHREGQVEMAREVCEALNERRHLLAEAGTGIGKSFAYLVPAALWARRNRCAVVVSTNTKNLQTQLLHKDLPAIRRALGGELAAALIKGRRNYLCLRRLQYSLRNADSELDGDERAPMAGLLTWMSETGTGDLAESGVCERPGCGSLRDKATSVAEDCGGRDCPYWKRCLLYRARYRAMVADIVVANHAVVFAEMGREEDGCVLPPHSAIVFDEAHNLEDAAVGWFSREISRARVFFSLRRLWRRGRRRRGAGAVSSLLHHLQRRSGGVADPRIAESAARLATELGDQVREAGAMLPVFLDALSVLLDQPGRPMSVRIDRGERDPETWAAIDEARRSFAAALAEVSRLARALSERLRDLPERSLPEHLAGGRDFDAVALWLTEFVTDLEFFLAAEDPDHVFWVERVSDREGGVRGFAAPVELGARFAEQLYGQKDTIVFTSATLSVGGSFAFLERRLGIDRIDAERIREFRAPASFDYETQCRVLVPMFLPEPGADEQAYTRELGGLLAELFRRTQGRALALFTSYRMLRESAEILAQALGNDGPRVLAQGVSGSREEITEAFKRDVGSVLLGTHSFWEGVDVMGEALSCLVITRLPFAVFTDPLVEARCERIEADGLSAFMNYSVPNAVIRFRQGFGRLIRHRTDRGIVVIADRRMITRRYGQWFRRSLPAATVPIPRRDEFLDIVDRFL